MTPRSAGVWLLLALGCERSPTPSVTKPIASVAAIAASTAPTPSASVGPSLIAQDELEPGQYASSVAIFKNDQLTACVDTIWNFPQLTEIAAKAGKSVQFVLDDDVSAFFSGGDTLLGSALAETAGKEATALLRPPGKPQTLNKICDKQFPARTIVSSCVVGAGKKIRVGIEFRSFDALAGNDRAMRGCLAAKGDWQEMATDSRDFIRERLQQRLRALQHN